MKSLFIKSLTKLITQLKLKGKTNAQFLKFSQKLTDNLGTQFKIKHLSRLADSPLRALLKIPCPGDQFDQTKIQAFKRLRNSYGIKQQTVCLKCPKINKCPFRYTQPQQKTQAKLQHLLYFLVSLEKCKQQEYSDLRWSSAYKVSQNLRIMFRNPQSLKQQSQIYQQINRNQQSKELEYKQKKDRKKSPTKISQWQRVYRLNKSTSSS